MHLVFLVVVVVFVLDCVFRLRIFSVIVVLVLLLIVGAMSYVCMLCV